MQMRCSSDVRWGLMHQNRHCLATSKHANEHPHTKRVHIDSSILYTWMNFHGIGTPQNPAHGQQRVFFACRPPLCQPNVLQKLLLHFPAACSLPSFLTQARSLLSLLFELVQATHWFPPEA